MAGTIDSTEWEQAQGANRAHWDERVPIHLRSDFYDVDGFRSGRPAVEAFEADEMGALGGCRLAHLQCHFGLDTLDLVRMHPTLDAVGLDFSAPAVAAAGALAEDLHLADRARFVAGNIYDAASILDAGAFDVVYTGKGALNWLPDLARWAEVVHGLLRPGGYLYLCEFHPVMWVFEETDARPVNDYFQSEAWVDETSGTYADLDAQTTANSSYEWQHTVADVISAVIAAGLRLEYFHEWDFTLFQQLPWLVEVGGQRSGRYRWPGPGTLPLMYSLRAERSG